MMPHQSGRPNWTYRCKQFSRSPSASLTISANTGITTQSFGFPVAANGVVAVAAAAGIDVAAVAVDVAVAVAGSALLMPAAATEAVSIVADAVAERENRNLN